LTPEPIYMCVLIFPYFLLTRSQGLDPCWWGTDRMRLFVVLVRSIWSLLRERPYSWRTCSMSSQ
jgi:hypothetical protein